MSSHVTVLKFLIEGEGSTAETDSEGQGTARATIRAKLGSFTCSLLRGGTTYIDVLVLDQVHVRLLSFYLSIFLFTLTMQGKQKQQKRTNTFFEFVFSYNTTSKYEHYFIHIYKSLWPSQNLLNLLIVATCNLSITSAAPFADPELNPAIDNSCSNVGGHASGRRARRTRAPCSVEWVYSMSSAILHNANTFTLHLMPN